MNLKHKTILKVIPVLFVAMVLFVSDAEASAEKFLDYYAPSNYYGTVLNQPWTVSYDPTWRYFGFKFHMKPSASVSVCEMAFYMDVPADVAGATFYVDVVATNNSSNYYNFTSDNQYYARSWLSSGMQSVTFYEGRMLAPQIGTLQECPTMFGGHEYTVNINFTGLNYNYTINNGSTETITMWKINKDLSSSTYDFTYTRAQRSSYTNAYYSEQLNLGDDVEFRMKMYGYPSWGTGLIGGVEYENVNIASYDENFEGFAGLSSSSNIGDVLSRMYDGLSGMFAYWFWPSDPVGAIQEGLAVVSTKAPFSWVNQLYGVWSGSSMGARASQSFSIEYQYSPSTSSVSFVLFSKDTVMRYIGSTTWAVLYGLMQLTIYWAAALYIYRRITNAI